MKALQAAEPQPLPQPVALATDDAGQPFLRQAAPWLFVLLCVALFLYVFSGVLMPFVAGIALGYLLDPVAEKLERMKLNVAIAESLMWCGMDFVVF